MPAQIFVDDAIIVIDAVIDGITTTVIELEDAKLLVKHKPPFILTSQVIISPFIKVVVFKILNKEFCTLIPFTLKLKVTVPFPILNAVAVKVVRVPWHIGPLIIVAIKTEDIRLAEIFTIKLFNLQ